MQPLQSACVLSSTATAPETAEHATNKTEILLLALLVANGMAAWILFGYSLFCW